MMSWVARLEARKKEKNQFTRERKPSTEARKRLVEKLWVTFAEIALDETPEEALAKLDTTYVTCFLDWYIEWKPDKHDAAHQSLSDNVNKEVNNYINFYMTLTYNLIVEPQNKPVFSVVDFVRLLEGLWKWRKYQPSLQLFHSLLNAKLMAYTATRPGAIVETENYQDEALQYRVWTPQYGFHSRPTLPGSIGYPFKEEFLNRPVCCRLSGVPITFDSLRYALARGGVATSAERNLTLQHRNSEVYESYYAKRDIEVDIQSSFLGTAPQSELSDALARLPRHLAVAGNLTTRSPNQGWGHEIEALLGRRTDLKNAKRHTGDSIELDKIDKEIRKLKERFRRASMAKGRADFFARVYSDEIARQLAGEGPGEHTEPCREYLTDAHSRAVEAILGNKIVISGTCTYPGSSS
ncbi:hypothetical protein C7212DRAFT_362121 [Tuber magnatum]|uniref:Uncharacterized protein n=1 Tax=Tuber magnatum TaxID=42249 RepID=A0A317T0P3_9PEZI|nr:hypothetical protein C7212DRAFT_362121 [Tuber magnatum]